MKLSLGIPGLDGDAHNFNGELNDGNTLPQGGLSVLQNIVKWGTTVLIISAVILALIFIIWGGIEWSTSGGDKEKLAKAQKKIIYASIGLIITLCAFMIINIVGGLFGVDFFS